MLGWALWLGAEQGLCSAGTAGTRGWEQRQNSSVAQKPKVQMQSQVPAHAAALVCWVEPGGLLPPEPLELLQEIQSVGQISTTGIHPCGLWGLPFSLPGSCSSRARWKLHFPVLLHRTRFAGVVSPLSTEVVRKGFKLNQYTTYFNWYVSKKGICITIMKQCKIFM